MTANGDHLSEVALLAFVDLLIGDTSLFALQVSHRQGHNKSCCNVLIGAGSVSHSRAHLLCVCLCAFV